MIQIQNVPEITDKIERLQFHLVLKSKTGNVYFMPSYKPANFMEKVFAELAMRKGDKSKLTSAPEDGNRMMLYQHFSMNENIYVQVFVNRDPNYIWIQKIRPTMNNLEIVGVKNQKKPVDVRIEPYREKVVLIQQVNAKNFQFIGGQGDFMLERIKKT